MSAFSIKAEGGAYVADRPEIRRALSLLIAPGERHELRGLPGGRLAVASGDDLDAATEAAVGLSDGQVYYSLNPLVAGASRANKKTVARRARILVDVDPIRPADVSSTDEEKAAAGDLACRVTDYLLDRGWPAPLMIDSGNGWHLLYAVDLPNDNLSHQLVKAVLAHLAGVHDTDAAKVDTRTHDAPRIAKLPGTMARKGTPTDERPHRMCRIAYEPESIELVTVEQLHALTAAVEPTNGHPGPSFATKATESGKAAYVKAAVERECYRVALAPSGERNEQLNKSAFALGQFSGWPEADEREIRETLRRAAERAGLTERETLLTIASGWTSGKASPRPRPVDAATVSAPAAPQGRLTIMADEVRSEVVQWIWTNVLALNFVNLFAGRTGIGKSFIMCDVAARLSKGLPMPDGTPTESPANTLFISEDPYQYVLKPRLEAHEADCSRIGFMRWGVLADYTLGNIDMLEASWLETGRPRLVVIDPPANYLGGKDEHKNAEVRSVLKLLTGWAESRPVAIAMITHFNKGAGKGLDAIYRFMGSVAWGTTARIACGCEVDPNDKSRCIFGGVKSNIGPLGQALGYRIEPTDVLAKVAWLGPVDTSIDDAMNKVKSSVAESIESWMEDRFREKRTWGSEELKQLALQNGFKFNAYKTYVKGVKKENVFDEDGKSTGWWWKAIPGWPPEKQSESAESAESVDASPSGIRKIKLSGVKRMMPKVHAGPESASGAHSDDRGGVPNVGAESSSGLTGQGVSETHSGDSGDSESSRAGAREGEDRTIDEMFERPPGWNDAWVVFDGRKSNPEEVE